MYDLEHVSQQALILLLRVSGVLWVYRKGIAGVGNIISYGTCTYYDSNEFEDNEVRLP